MLCLICDNDISKNHFPQHLKKNHSISKSDYKLKFNLQNYCACGCEAKIKDGLKWAKGHHQRVNNISKRPDIREKRRKKMQEWHDSGEWQPWNKGISDERTRKNSDAMLKTRSKNEVWRKNASDNLKKIRKKYLGFGPKSPNWKGGTSPIHALIRADHTFYTEWKYPILKRDNFSCTVCSSTMSLEVHHDKEQMSEVLRKFVSKTDSERDWKEKRKVVEQVIEYHLDTQVSGVTLCKACHKNLHESYNF